MKFLKIIILTVILILAMSFVTLARPEWQTLKTEHFTVFYLDGHILDAMQVIQSLEYYRPRLEKLTGNQAFHLPIVIDDTGTQSNGFSNPLGYQIHLFQYPPGMWAGAENWWTMVGVHEYTHQLTLAKRGGVPQLYFHVFGNDLFSNPNLISPGWIIEGITVYSESQLSNYQGRLNDGLFDSYLGARVKDGRFPTILNGTFSPMEFQLGGIYTWGGEFLNYLSKTYGEEKFAQYFAVNGSSFLWLLDFPALGIDNSARQVFGKSFPELWRDWQVFETKRWENFRYEGERITTKGWYTSNPRIVGRKLYYQRTYPEKTTAFNGFGFADIVERDLDSGKETVLVSTTSGFTVTMEVKQNKLYYSTLDQKASYGNSINQSYGYFNVLHCKDLGSGNDRVILEKEFRAFSISVNGQVLYSIDRNGQFGSEIYCYDPSSKTTQKIFETDYLVNEIANNGAKVVVSARKDWEDYSIYSVNLNSHEFVPLVNTRFAEGNISLQDDKLIFTANYQKVYAIYCYDFASGKLLQLTTNGCCQYGAYDRQTQQLYLVELNSFGYDLYRKPAEFNEYQLPETPKTTPPAFNLSGQSITRGNYTDNLKTLKPQGWAPWLEYDNDRNFTGISFFGNDAIGDFPSYILSLGYDANHQRIGTQLSLTSNYFAPWNFTLSYNDIMDKELSFDVGYPFFSRLSPGISTLKIGTAINYQGEQLELPEYEPYVMTDFRLPKTWGTLKISSPFSQTNGINRTGLYGKLRINQYLAQGQLTLNALGIKDPNKSDSAFKLIRGYTQKLNAREGSISSLDYSHPLFQIHNGLWNPNLYFEDVCGGLFVDQAVANSGERQVSWGAELHLETKMLYSYIPLDWGLRYVQTIEGDNRVDLFLKGLTFE